MSGEIPNLIPALPELFLAVAAIALLMVGVFMKRGATLVVGWLSVATLIATAFLVLAGEEGTTTTFNGLFVVDGYGVFMKVLVLAASAVTLIMALDWLRQENIARFEYPVIVLFATLGMLMMVSANDLMSLYLGLELQSLSLYVLAAYHRDDARSSESGLKYFVLGALASGLLLYGASLVYGFAGSTSFAVLAEQFSAGEAPIGVTVGLVFVLAGLAFKVSAVPFHMWTPDVYEGAPTPVTAFFAVAPKIAAIALLLRVMVGPFGGLVDQWQQVVVLMAVLSMGLGAFAAIGQENIKRLLAYSSIGNVGYGLIGLAVGTAVGVRGVLIFFAIYLVMSLGVFALVLSMRIQGRAVEAIDDLKGLSRGRPLTAAAMAALMFSMAGIPPLAGFFGKLYIFLAAIEAGMYLLAVLGVLASVVSAYYYLRIIKVMYFDEPVGETLERPGKAVGAVLAVSTVLVVGFFIYPSLLVIPAQAAANVLFGG